MGNKNTGYQKPENVLDPNDFESVTSIANFVRQHLSIPDRLHCAIICGSGLGGLAESLDNQRSLPYSKIPGFVSTSVPGHQGALVFGELSSKNVLCVQGRVHPYEGHSMSQCALPVRVAKSLGADFIILTAAAGGLNPSFKVGDLMLVRDHIFVPGLGLQGPLVGTNDNRLGPRFPHMYDAYDKELQSLAKRSGEEMGIKLVEGNYAMTGGPHFTSRLEEKFLLRAGADAVGMSVCHEAVVARHGGMRVFALALITDMCEVDEPVDGGQSVTDIHSQVVEIANQKSKQTAELVKRILSNCTCDS